MDIKARASGYKRERSPVRVSAGGSANTRPVKKMGVGVKAKGGGKR